MKSLFKPRNSTFEEIVKNAEKTRRIEGNYQGHHWRLTLGVKDPHGIIEENAASRARFNPESQPRNILCAFWFTEKELEDFLHRKQANQLWVETQTKDYLGRNPNILKENPTLAAVQIEQIENQVPYSPAELRHTAACGAVFDLEKIESLINQKAETYRKTLGLLPKTSTVIPYWASAKETYQPILIVTWA